MNNNSNSAASRYWAVVPAAGVGKRMGSNIPKQYLELHGRTVIEHTLGRLCAHPNIEAVVVALGDHDEYWQQLAPANADKLLRTDGGEERCHSVHNGLLKLADQAHDDDWVLVHDAARPCLHRKDIDRLIETLANHPVGGLLGVPVADTMKRTAANGEVIDTVSRDNLWRAMTPQMFRYGVLKQALADALDDGFMVTDEASAIEHAGHKPLMVECRADNIKITRPEDLALAEMYLARQEEEA
ncbi:2-C-methyl-D-erythritol 4-phosphate cytidylyltransferase [Pseudomonadota bacterium]